MGSHKISFHDLGEAAHHQWQTMDRGLLVLVFICLLIFVAILFGLGVMAEYVVSQPSIPIKLNIP